MTTGLCRLDELAEIKLGVKTFLNQFFYVDRERVQKFGIEGRYLEPVLRVNDVNRDVYLQDPRRTENQIFLCDKTVEQLVGTGAAAYIRWGSRATLQGQEGRASRVLEGHSRSNARKAHLVPEPGNAAGRPDRRFELIDETISPLVLNKAIRVDQSYNQSQREKRYRRGRSDRLALFCMVRHDARDLRATSMGQGALQVPTETLRGLLVPDIRKLDDKTTKAWKKAGGTLIKGQRLPTTKLATSKQQRDLDALVLQALSFDASRLDELYDETANMHRVRRRLAAGRVKMRRERFDADLADVAKDMAAQLKPLIQGRRFPQDFLPAGAATTSLHLGTAPLKLRAELMMGQRHIRVDSAGSTVLDTTLPTAVADLLIRALQLKQRSVDLPDQEAEAEAALLELDRLVSQIDFRLNELAGHAGAQHQASIRTQAEEELNFPVSQLKEPLLPVYEADIRSSETSNVRPRNVDLRLLPRRERRLIPILKCRSPP